VKVLILPSAQDDLAEGFAFYEKQQFGAVFKIHRRSAYALRVSGKPSWAGVDLGGTGRWPASASAALAEHGLPLT